MMTLGSKMLNSIFTVTLMITGHCWKPVII